MVGSRKTDNSAHQHAYKEGLLVEKSDVLLHKIERSNRELQMGLRITSFGQRLVKI